MQAPENTSVYFVSTLLHLFVATSLAQSKPDERSVLVYIDQPEGVEPLAYQLTRRWSRSPFAEHILFFGRFRGGLNKLKKRKALFRKIDALIRQERPGNIYVGNDRRIEFQYAMHVAETLQLNPVGHYMDEGTFTYVGRQASSQFGDVVVDNLLKKLSYGLWWKNPTTVGASDWISEIHVAFPEQIDSRLTSKAVSQLTPESFQCPALIELSEMMLADVDVSSDDIAELDVLLTLPHESLFQKDSTYADKILSIVNGLEGRVAVKYHPRNSAEDALGLTQHGVKLLPSKVSFEAVLPHLKGSAKVIGDVSSTLLLTRWLRPEVEVISYRNGNENEAFEQLFQNLEIDVR